MSTKSVIDSQLSIYQHISAHINPSGPGLLPEGYLLPDDDVKSDGDMVWVPGAMDMLSGHPQTYSPQQMDKIIKAFSNAFINICKANSRENLAKLERILSFPDTLVVIDKVIQNLISLSHIDHSTVYHTCKTLLLSSRNRGVVKFCTAVTGLYGFDTDLFIFKTLARHDEFTLYCSVAAAGCVKNPEDAWLEMAENVTGWGRIHLVNRLVKINKNKVKDFLLRKGCINDIMPEYSACSIAGAVKLAERLKTGGLSREEYIGAGTIIKGLIQPLGKSRLFSGVEWYSNTKTALMEYLKISEKMAFHLDDYLTVSALKRTALPKSQGGCKEDLNWEDDCCASIIKTADGILQNPKWKEKALQGLKSVNQQKRLSAVKVCRQAGFSVEETLMEELEKDPIKPELWFGLIKSASFDSIDKLVSFVAKVMEKFVHKNLHLLQAGQKGLFITVDDSGYAASHKKNIKSLLIISGQTFLFNRCLELLLTEMEKFSGRGFPLIAQGLMYGELKVKLLALRGIYHMDSSAIPENIRRILKNLSAFIDREIEYIERELQNQKNNSSFLQEAGYDENYLDMVYMLSIAVEKLLNRRR